LCQGWANIFGVNLNRAEKEQKVIGGVVGEGGNGHTNPRVCSVWAGRVVRKKVFFGGSKSDFDMGSRENCLE